jgi:hypothetical protein
MSTDKLIETHGKEESKTPTTLEQIWGYNELGRYGTNDEKVYAEKIGEMNRAELERHARNVGVMIIESSARLKENLQKEFRNYFLLLNKPVKTSTHSASSTTSPQIDPEVKKILAEGR